MNWNIGNWGLKQFKIIEKKHYSYQRNIFFVATLVG